MSATAQLTLEVERGSEPITGRITGEHGTHGFIGWLELATALQAVLEGSDLCPRVESSD